RKKRTNFSCFSRLISRLPSLFWRSRMPSTLNRCTAASVFPSIEFLRFSGINRTYRSGDVPDLPYEPPRPARSPSPRGFLSCRFRLHEFPHHAHVTDRHSVLNILPMPILKLVHGRVLMGHRLSKPVRHVLLGQVFQPQLILGVETCALELDAASQPPAKRRIPIHHRLATRPEIVAKLLKFLLNLDLWNVLLCPSPHRVSKRIVHWKLS